MSNLRQFTMYGRRAEFNKTAFCHYVKQKSRREKIAISKLEELIGESVGVSANAVHHWIYKKGGPGDAVMIAPLAKILDIADPAQDNAMAENFFTILKTECIYWQNQRHSRKRMI